MGEWFYAESMSTACPTVIGIGEVLWDMLPAGRQIGGAPANFAFHARQLGAEAVIVSAVGDDRLGRELREQLARRGIDTEFIATLPNRSTGTVSVRLDPQGVPEYTIHVGVAWDELEASDDLEGLAMTADAVCFGTLAQRMPVSRKTIQWFLSETRDRCLRVFDINLRQRFYDASVVDHGLRVARVLKLNDQELPVVRELLQLPQEEDDAITALMEMYDLKAVALTRGAGGSSLVWREGRSDLPAMATKVVDTVGAGDAFTAALVMGMLAGEPLEAVHEHAARIAAEVCAQPGAMPTQDKS